MNLGDTWVQYRGPIAHLTWAHLTLCAAVPCRPPLEFDDDDELERFCERMAETQQLSGYETLEPEQLADTSSS